MRKILIVGNFLEIGRTEELYIRGFSTLGCEVKCFTWTEAQPSLVSRALFQRVAWRLGWKMLAKAANQTLIEIANQFQPDLTFVISPLLIHPSIIPALQKHGLVFAFFTDNPLDNHHTHSNIWVQRGLPLWDAVLIWSQELVTKLTKLGVKQVLFHPFCSDVQYHFPKRQANPIYDVAFIGNWDASRKREQYLKAVAHTRLGIWGSSYWKTHCKEASINGCFQGMCAYEKLPEVLGSAKIGLNILRPQNESGHNIRTFEIPASGILMLSERSGDIMNLFREDKEAVYFSSPEELKQKTDYLLENFTLAESIATAGYKNCLNHTITTRILEVAELYFSLK